MPATLLRKQLSFEMELTEGDRAFIAKISTDALDRDREVLLPQGMDASDFEKNPVVFFNHEHRSVPVGKVVSLRRMADHWLAKVVLAARPAAHVGEWLPDTLLSLIQQGVVRGMSVGFEPVEARAPSKKDKETFGPEVTRVFSKWKLVELSIAPLPANQEALIVAVSKKLITAAQAKSVGIDVPAATLPAVATAKRVVIVYQKYVKADRPKHPSLTELLSQAVTKELDRRRGRLYS